MASELEILRQKDYPILWPTMLFRDFLSIPGNGTAHEKNAKKRGWLPIDSPIVVANFLGFVLLIIGFMRSCPNRHR